MATAPAQHLPEPTVRRRPAYPGDALVSVASVAARPSRFQPGLSASEPGGVRHAMAEHSSRLPADATIVALAHNFIAAHLSRPLGPEVLVGATGVPLDILKRAIFGETGLGIASFVHRTRLDQARAWLSSNRETRSQTEIALALGFVSPAAFSRSYQRRFGETMTETRRRAVQEADARIASTK